MNPLGVSKPSEFEWSNGLMRSDKKITPQMIDDLLKPFDEVPWGGYSNSRNSIIKEINYYKN